MGLIKLGIAILILSIFQSKSGLVVTDDMMFLGLCVILSAYVMHETVDNRTYITTKEEDDEK